MRTLANTLDVTLAITLILGACAPSSSGYFPPGALQESPRLDAHYRRWYGEQLAALREPPLATTPENAHVIRALVLQHYGRPTSYRVVIRPGGGGVLHYRMATRRETEDAEVLPGRLIRFHRVRLSREQISRLLEALEAMDFWAAGPSLGSMPHGHRREAVLEVTRDGHYHVLHDADVDDLGHVTRLLWRYSRRLRR